MSVAISVVVPVRDEKENIEPQIREILDALAGEAFEIIYVDDGSQDGTTEELARLSAELPELRALRHAESCGQSSAIRTGARAAAGRLIATLDGDMQNMPADLPTLLSIYRQASGGRDGEAGIMVAGQRAKRQDNAVRRFSSRFANGLRGWLLGDGVRDTGCGLKLFEREMFLALPYFDHMHRYLPALWKREGGRVLLQDVGHRPRPAGRSKYGTLGRAAVGIVDLMGVAWLQRRRRLTRSIDEIGGPDR